MNTGTPADLAPRLRSAADAIRDEQLARLREITALDAPSGDSRTLKPVEELLVSWLTELGGSPVLHPGPAGSCIEARFEGSGGSHRQRVVLCHFDTVWPSGTAASRPLRLDGDRISGPGVLDMRGGIVAALGAIEILLDLAALADPVTVVLTPDEETGSRSSLEVITRAARSAEIVLVPEPALPGGALKTSRKGWLSYELHTRGRAVHAGLEPESGINAIDEMVDQLVELRQLVRGDVGTTVSCGLIRGGTEVNVVPDRAVANIDIRVPDRSEETRVRGFLDGLNPVRADAGLTVELLHSRPPLERSPAIAAAAARASELGRLLGMKVGEGDAGGVSDANIAAAEGAVVLDGLGPVGGGAHAVDEWVSRDSITDRTALIALLLAAS